MADATIMSPGLGAAQGLRAFRLSGLSPGARVCEPGRQPPATSFVLDPEPETFGSFEHGMSLCDGVLRLSGEPVSIGRGGIWAAQGSSPLFKARLHGYRWLDDLAAAGTRTARRLARGWTAQWILKFPEGSGLAWDPAVCGARAFRLVGHSSFLLRDADEDFSYAYFTSLSGHVRSLSYNWHLAKPGLSRLEALSGLLHLALSLEGLRRLGEPVMEAIASECAACVDATGGIESRNPEELLDVFSILVSTFSLAEDCGISSYEDHALAVHRIASALRTLRHANGDLARFHGGSAGAEGKLDKALAAGGVKGRPDSGISMGFARLSAGRVSVIADAAPPPSHAASPAGHASALAFEFVSGRRPVIVNCGCGAEMGGYWLHASRDTPSHSALEIEGQPSSEFVLKGDEGHGSAFELRTPCEARGEVSRPSGRHLVSMSHRGYVKDYGLTHSRELSLSESGRELTGMDFLSAAGPDREIFKRAVRKTRKLSRLFRSAGIGFALHFHLHPDVRAQIASDGKSALLRLKSGEEWRFLHEGGARMRLARSVYLPRGSHEPVDTVQILLSSVVKDSMARVFWTLVRVDSDSRHIRDIERDGPVYPGTGAVSKRVP